MQRRNSTKSRGLDHRKSTSSIQSQKSVNLQHICPERAERDVQIAATRAMERGRERANTDASMWPPSRSSIDQPELPRFHSTPDRLSNGSAIRKQQSVRFVKPRPPRDAYQGSRVSEDGPHRNMDTSLLHTRESTFEARSPSSASASGLASAAKGAAGDYISALITGEEYYTPEDDIASAPSSYRRVRKSRSMFTSSEISGMTSARVRSGRSSTMQQLPMSNTHCLNISNDENVPPSELKAPKSMSFLKGRREHSGSIFHRRGSAPLAEIDTGYGYSSANQCGLKPSRSYIMPHPRPYNPNKVFKKTLRNISNGDTTAEAKIPKNGSLRLKARKVSLNFKHKLKSLISLVKGESEEAGFPPQQIEAHKTHVKEMDGSEDKLDDGYMNLPPSEPSEDAAMSRVTSGVPSLHAVPSEQQIRSRQGSMESLQSERKVSDEKSRVTSWTNSDANTFTTMGSQRGDWERKRLSVIKENGSHISSSSNRLPLAVLPRADSSDNVFGVPSTQPVPMATADGQRIYSALMKHINEHQSLAQSIEMHRKQSIEDFVNRGTVPPRRGSRDRDGHSSGTPTTIRHVIAESDSEDDTARAASTSTIIHGPKDKRCLPEGLKRLYSTEKESRGRRRTSSSTENVGSRDKTFSLSKTGAFSPRSRTSPGIGNLSVPPRTLSARSSAFFGSPTCHMFRTKSPYRRALQGSMKDADDFIAPKSPEFNPWMVSLNNLPVRRLSPCESEEDKKMGYEESIYSPAPPASRLPMDMSTNTISIVDRFPNPPTNHGDATIFVNSPFVRPPEQAEGHSRVTSSASSVEWKTWLSANVSKIERDSTENDRQSLFSPFNRSPGHVREPTQICDEDESEKMSAKEPEENPESGVTENTLATIEPNIQQFVSVSRSVPKNKCPTPLSSKENEAPKLPPPPIPVKSTMRSTPSISSMRSNNEVFKTPLELSEKETLNLTRSKPLPHVRSLNALGNQARSRPTTAKAKLVKRQNRPQSCITPMVSPGLSAAVEKQFGPIGSSSDSKRRQTVAGPVKNENISPCIGKADVAQDEAQDIGHVEEDEELDAQSLGCKRMVDLFLNSRRKRIAGSEDTNAFV